MKGAKKILKANQNVRRAARADNIPLWRLALQIGVSEQTLIRWLRVPLPNEKEKQIMEAISTLAAEADDGEK